MKLQMWKTPLAGGLVALAGLMALPSSNAQESDEGLADVLIERREIGPPGMERVPLDVMKLRMDAPGAAVDGVKKRIIALRGGPDHMRSLREAAAAVNNAESDEAKDQAQERLEQLLDDFFNDDMKRREQELSDIEERLKKLRTSLDRRREKRREIVDLQRQVLLNEADGLGFFGGDQFFFEGGKPFEYHVEAFPAAGMPPHPPRAAVYVQPPHAAPQPARVPAPPREPAPRRDREREREGNETFLATRNEIVPADATVSFQAGARFRDSPNPATEPGISMRGANFFSSPDPGEGPGEVVD